MRAVGRLFAALVGFIAAVVAAGLFLLAAKVGLGPPPAGEEALWWSRLVVQGGFAASVLGAMAFVPGAVLILVSEIFSLRSIVFHVGAGGLMGLAATLRAERLADPAAPPLAADVALMVAAGFVGGFVYWLIAGRMAGLKPLGPPAGSNGTLSPPGP